ncbi:Bax inhibitor-1/YccA family protein [Dysgonomonas massiliensis]|uniref:Bax inhibitor-1/YccA family protein n=1 Tax=Dysgonomonas massiliensis TaxID=2040292 RepID=UPI000C763636|nr:Bax inhibitor-1/YccA family protein [Dysgonomonas massiliensis]
MELERREGYTQQSVQTPIDAAVGTTAYRTLFRNVYLWMTLAMVITAATAYTVAVTPALLNIVFSNKIFFYVVLFAPLALVWYLSARINKISFATATSLFIVYSILVGLTLSVIFLAYTGASIAMVFGITAGTFGTMALIGTFTKVDLSKLGGILMMALVGLIIASVVNIFWANDTLYWIVSYAGVLIFVGLTAYDAQKIKRQLQAHGYEINDTTQKIALMGALSLYLDFLNMFLFLLRIFGDRR